MQLAAPAIFIASIQLTTQAAEIRNVNGVKYEYFDATISPYHQVINSEAGGAGEVNDSLSKADLLAIYETRASNSVAAVRAKAGQPFGLCSPGELERRHLLTQGSSSGRDSYVLMVTGIKAQVQKDPQSCAHQWEVRAGQAAETYITWTYSCPHGSSEVLEDPTKPMRCRRPIAANVCMVGNPVSHTCDKFQPEQDYRSADGLLSLVRSYSSSRLPQPGWATNYESLIQFTGASAILMRGDGSRQHFTYSGGKFIPLAPTSARLLKTDSGFTYITSNDEQEYYNARGMLTRIVSRDGKTVTLEISTQSDTKGTLTATDPYGRKLVMSYEVPDEGGSALYLRKALLPDGTQYEFRTNPLSGMIDSVTREGYERRYHYGAFDGLKADINKLMGITDENNRRYAEFAYGFANNGPKISTQHYGGVQRYEVTDRRYQNGTGTVLVSEPLGLISSYQYEIVNGISRMVAITRGAQGTSTLSYDANGNIATQIDFNGNLVKYRHDLSRNLEISRTEGLSATGAITADTRTIETVWHPVFQLPTVELIKNAQGVAIQQTNRVYDHFGHLTSHSVKDLLQNQTRTTSYDYRYASTIPWHVESLTITGPRQDKPDVTRIDYWPADAACPGTGMGRDKGCRGQIKSISNSLNQTTQFAAYDAHGRAIAIRDPNDLLTELTYTPRGWLTAATVEDETTLYEYDGVGLLKTITLPDDTHLTHSYDDANRLTGIANNLGHRVKYELDNMGNRTIEVVKAPNGNIQRQITRAYDNLNRLRALTGAAQ